MTLRAPFPWFGGKSRVAHLVWERLGDVRNYVEPFAGSLAVLLGRPHPEKIETVNDLDAYLANFWRAVRSAPDEVAEHANWPVNEVDLHARHRWLVETGSERVDRLRTDPKYFDAQVAGWWVWGVSQWIGGGWCHGNGVHAKRPQVAGDHAGKGVLTKKPVTQGHKHGLGVHQKNAAGVHGPAAPGLVEWMASLSNRLRRVRVCCGDWGRVMTPTVLRSTSFTGIFLDPPYDQAQRDKDLYREDADGVAGAVRAWCLEHGDNPAYRIALCGYEGEHDGLEGLGWDVVAWTAPGGYANARGGQANKNRTRERIWFSPHCLTGAQRSLFEAVYQEKTDR